MDSFLPWLLRSLPVPYQHTHTHTHTLVWTTHSFVCFHPTKNSKHNTHYSNNKERKEAKPNQLDLYGRVRHCTTPHRTEPHVTIPFRSFLFLVAFLENESVGWFVDRLIGSSISSACIIYS
mmetsp:Transcript_14613/g.31122  ORF Transcript_14613/g.31122 Transcript_14613/m.31122 type:complete len:121 (-) Transcript_14613:376-738(-)